MAFQGKVVRSIGVGIVAFEGTEHLASIISEFRDIVDYVVIGLQRKSYHGDPIEPIDLNEIVRLRDEDHLVDNIIDIKLDTTKEPRIQETDKRNLIIQDIENHGCSHALVIDSDEYYTHKSILRAVQEIDEHDYEITYCQYINYYADYSHFLVYPFKDGMYVPFIAKTKYRHKFECYDTVNGHTFQFPDFNLPSDPTRRFVRPFDRIDIVQLPKGQTFNDASGQKLNWMPKKHYLVDFHVFPWETVKMHHLSWVRADIRKKVNSWSSKTCFQDYNDLIDKAIDVYNHFDHNSKEQQTASLLFNTPNHEVYVRALPRQYIHPKYDYLTRLRPAKNEKKIAIMNLSTVHSKVHLYEKLEQCGKETWAKDVIDGKYPNIDYWTVLDCEEESHIDETNHIIYIKSQTENNIYQLLNRWLEAYKIIAATKKYDYILRVNPSTWVNIEFINEMLAVEKDDSKIFTHKFYAAFWSSFNIYCSGAAMVWPARNMPILEQLTNANKKCLDYVLDDIAMSTFWRHRAKILGLSDVMDSWVSLEGYCLWDEYNNIDWSNVDIKTPMVQIKTPSFKDDSENKEYLRIDNDVFKMQKYDELYRQWRNTLSDEEFVKFVYDYMHEKVNNTVTVLPMSRDQWINGNIKDKMWQIYNPDNVKELNDDVFKYLNELQIKYGYIKKED